MMPSQKMLAEHVAPTDSSDKRSELPSNPPMTVAEYFAGIGLIRLGLEQAGWNVLFANDFDASKYQMYVNYYIDAAEHYDKGDIFKIEPDSVPSTTLATSSFPCIDLSLAGNLNGLSGEHSSAFWGFIRVLEKQGEQRPPLVMLENVPGWLSSNKGQDFRVTIEALNQLGYSVDVFSLDAQRFTPQSRLRIFAVGSRQERPAEQQEIQRLLGRSRALAPARLKQAIQTHHDLAWRFLDIPEPPPIREKGLSQDVIETIPPTDERWWDSEKVARHIDMMSESHRARLEQLKNQNTTSYRTLYRRRRAGEQRAEIRKGDTAGCLRTARGGSSRQILVAVGAQQVRMRFMTPREYARLQGVPDEYPIPKTLRVNEALTGFGDAVCVPAIKWIAVNVLTQLLDEL